MTIESTPEHKSSESTCPSASKAQSPATPKLPFDPPRRRSSLAFSKMTELPQRVVDMQDALLAGSIVDNRTPGFRSNVGKKRTSNSPLRHSGALPGHVSQIQKVFQTAQANLQLDMHFAASPVGSIDSRLPNSGGAKCNTKFEDKQSEVAERSWRYSTIPKLFSITTSDVREPLPDASPNLPAITSQQNDDMLLSVEPASSGYTSPVFGNATNSIDSMSLPPLPCSSPVRIASDNGDSCSTFHNCSDEADEISKLTQPMTGLKVANDTEDCCEQSSDDLDDSPIVDHLRRKSTGSHNSANYIPNTLDNIFLSQSACAAAESAKAKRDLLKQAFDRVNNKENIPHGNQYYRQARRNTTAPSCPDPALHDYLATTPCPDPLAHVQASRTESFPRQPRTSSNNHGAPRGMNTYQNMAKPIRPRTTAAGSPMPFVRRALSPHEVPESVQPLSPHFASSTLNRSWHLPSIHSTPYVPHHTSKPSEHFRPGWYYANGPSNNNSNNRPPTNLYSFSTAAAKMTGESAAPDSRIRNSYRTDTLTPLACPPGRFRKNRTTVMPQSSRSHQHHIDTGLIPRSEPKWPPPGPRRMQPLRLQNLESRSSPPLPSNRYEPSFKPTKRSYDDSVMPDFDIADDESAASTEPSTALLGSDKAIEVDDDTRAAVRMPLYCSNMPECLEGEREGIRELSPNVRIWRKELGSGSHHRKRRRPSYWDGDLEEVTMSPAGRGGIVSSPTISKRSMMAELESLSNCTDATTAEDFELVGSVRVVAQSDGVENTNEVEMTDFAELEA